MKIKALADRQILSGSVGSTGSFGDLLESNGVQTEEVQSDDTTQPL